MSVGRYIRRPIGSCPARSGAPALVDDHDRQRPAVSRPRRSVPRRASRPSPRSSPGVTSTCDGRDHATRRASSGSPRRGSRCRCVAPPNGMVLVAPAASTPGSARTRRSASSVKRAARVVVRVARAGQRDRGGQSRARDEAGIDLQHVAEAREQQAGADQQHEGEGHLGHDQRAAQRARAARRPSPLRPSSRSTPRRVGAQRACASGHEPDHDADHEREPERVERPTVASSRISVPCGRSWRSKAAERAQRAAPSSEAQRRPRPA